MPTITRQFITLASPATLWEVRTMSGDLVPFGSGGDLAEMVPGRVLTSYDRADPAQAIALYRAVQASDRTLDEMEGQTIAIEHVVSHMATLVDQETGEVGETLRTVLIGPDGARYSTRSETVARDLARVVHLLGRPLPWNPPIQFVVRRVANRGKTRKYLQLEPLV